MVSNKTLMGVAGIFGMAVGATGLLAADYIL